MFLLRGLASEQASRRWAWRLVVIISGLLAAGTTALAGVVWSLEHPEGRIDTWAAAISNGLQKLAGRALAPVIKLTTGGSVEEWVPGRQYRHHERRAA